MKQEFSHQYMKENCGCYEQEKLLSCSFMQKAPVLLSDILHSEIPLKDKFWFVCHKVATKEQNQVIAISVAEMVLPIFEAKYPNDSRPREAIEAAKRFIEGRISIEELQKKRRAADAAADAAYAYVAARAAADAAYAAVDAAAVDAAARAAAYYGKSDQLLEFLINFCIQEPITENKER